MRAGHRLPLVLLLVAAGGCGGDWSALNPGGPEAGRIALLWWVMLAVAAAVSGAVTIGLLVALFRRRTTAPDPLAETPRESRPVILLGLVLPAIVLLGVFVASIALMQRSYGDANGPLQVEVTGQQWWWEVRYPQHDLVTANEIVIPVGRPVELSLATEDVIHSFWPAPLAGKIDMIPGRVTTLTLSADEPGEYPGQCAEFCGLQHARMRFLIIAETEEEFERWLAQQRTPPGEPETASAQAGEELFLTSSCALCHAVEGTPADGRVGPDLTHFATRRTLGAGIAPNNRENLADWVRDAQSMKPGNIMPAAEFRGDDLEAVLDYLETLE